MRYLPGAVLKLNFGHSDRVIKITKYHSGGLHPWYEYDILGITGDAGPRAADDTEEIETNAEPLTIEEGRLVALLYE